MKLYDLLHLEIVVLVIPFDRVGNSLATLHPWLDQLGKLLEDSWARLTAVRNRLGISGQFHSKISN